MQNLVCLTFLVLTSVTASAQDVPLGAADPTNPVSIALETLHADLQEQRGSVTIPIHTAGRSWSWLAFRGYRALFDQSILFPSRNLTVADDIGAVDANYNWAWTNDKGEITSVSAGIGVTGRRLLNPDNVTAISVNALHERKLENKNNWLFGLNYSNNRTVFNNIPIPIVAYVWNGERTKIVAGMPFLFALWRPMPVILSAMVSPFFAMAEASVFALGPIQVYGNYAWAPRVFQNLDSTDRDARLFYVKQELGFGFRIPFSRTSHVSIGYAHDFRRSLFFGTSLSNAESEKISYGAADAIQAKLKWAF